MIRIRGLNLSFGPRLVLNDIHLEVRAGERVALIGSNGAGKTSLLKVISGMTKPGAGEVEVLGVKRDQPLSRFEARRIAQVFQGLHLVGRLNTLENVLIGRLGYDSCLRAWSRRFSKENIEIARSYLRRLGLSETARVEKLSGGQRQQVAVLRALAQRGDLLLADEATAALDPETAQKVCSLMSSEAQGKSLVSVVHNLAHLEYLADRVIGMKDGRITFDVKLANLTPERLAEIYK